MDGLGESALRQDAGGELTDREARALGVLARQTRVMAESLDVDSRMRLRLEVLADDLTRAAVGGPVRLRLM